MNLREHLNTKTTENLKEKLNTMEQVLSIPEISLEVNDKVRKSNEDIVSTINSILSERDEKDKV